MFNSNYFVYITTNPKRTTYYIGVTNDLQRRLQEHFNNYGNKSTFAGKYYCYNLIYFERFTTATDAIDREKQLKNWSRSKKEFLIRQQNPCLKFLNAEVLEE
ncbi:MAG: GIY-YIG nuclease family protein [Hymenobacteraceae bacterium]|nr:GIY-YIG nuclease family protein [Hymenobacteraceae bacterium]MDX5395703.1 GIY-YIG nuclease family protein [Hymenobacteraceae bacterium]MDX5511755.1 GIY-YIG nuclease family protein [Hymenobacteraceae bacterium]